MTRRHVFLALAVLAVVAVAGFAWSALLRPLKVQVAEIQQNVDVQVFGLGTVEARIASKVGF